MNVETVHAPVIAHQADLSKLMKPKPAILSPNLENNIISPNGNNKHTPRKKNYVSLRKFNSSFATVGSHDSQKITPKIQFLQQQAALADLPENRSCMPQSPKGKHRRTYQANNNFESKLISEVQCEDSEMSGSKLMIDDTELSTSSLIIQNSEKMPESMPTCSSPISKPVNHNSALRKRKSINPSNSFSNALIDGPKVNPSFSMVNFTRKSLKSLSGSNDNLIDNNLSSIQNKGIKSVSSKLSLKTITNDLMITIKFSSNWGNPSTLILSTIAVLDEKKKILPIKTISSLPDLPNVNLLKKFTDQNLVKNDNEVSPINFDFSSNDKFSIILTLDRFADPRYIRIWNPKIKDENLLTASSKNVEVYIKNKVVAQGEVPQNFGIDLELEDEELKQNSMKQCNSSLLIEELFPSFRPEEDVSDQFGIYPFPKIKTVSIEVLSTYKNFQKMDQVGINGIDFYNDEGIKLDISHFDSIKVKNIITSSYANPKYIVRASMKTCCMDYQFLGNPISQSDSNNEDVPEISSSTNNPLFIFTLAEPINISMMRIWNFNSAEEGLDYGIQKIIIKCNDKLFWTGKVKKGSGLITGIERSVTNIWLTDSQPIREIVSQKLNNSVDDE